MVGELLGCIRSVNAMKIFADDFGESCPLSPTFMTSVIVLSNTHRPLLWRRVGDV